MKAKFIYENMEFERGQEPKEAMGIGLVGELKKSFDELNKIKDDVYGLCEFSISSNGLV